MMAFLEYVSDGDFLDEVRYLIEKAIKKRDTAEGSFHKNVIDPFSSLFEASDFQDHSQWKNSEMARQYQKTIQNHVGSFHQRLLGHVTGWQDLGVGQIVDLHNPERKIIAEIKNKYNTVTGGDLASKYYSLEKLVSQKHSRFKGYCAYFVNIIPQKPIRSDIPFTPSDKERGDQCPTNEKIRKIDGSSFYTLVTGRENALKELHSVLIDAIECVYKTQLGRSGFRVNDREAFMQYFNVAYGKK